MPGPRRVLALLLLTAVACLSPVSIARAATATAPVLRVQGNRIVDATGTTIKVAGVNRSGSEYACVQGWGMFDGPVDDASIAAIAAWGGNVVRIPLNEDCWLGINGIQTQYGGASYQAAISGLVQRLHAHGMAAILDLHWAASGTTAATGQIVAPDASHAPAFWTSVATAYEDDPSVAFELFNEPHDISWDCWRDGCTTSDGWQATGTQQLVNAVRATGATQPIILDGLQWGGDLSEWAAHAPTDPQHALIAGWHLYDFSGCHTADCWSSTVAPLASTYPVLLTEVGESDCAGTFLDTALPWADAHGIGYVAWAWDTASCSSGPSLISSYDGTPTAYGSAFKRYLEAGSPVLQALPTFTMASTVTLRVTGQAASYDVKVQRAPFNGPFQSASQQESLTVPLAKGYTYCFSIRAQESSAWSAPACTATPLDDTSLTASNGWTRETGSQYYGGTATRTTTIRSTLWRSQVTTRRIALVAARCKGCATVGIYWNGTLLQRVSLNLATTKQHQLLPTIDLGKIESGTLTVRTLNTARAYLDGIALSRT